MMRVTGEAAGRFRTRSSQALLPAGPETTKEPCGCSSGIWWGGWWNSNPCRGCTEHAEAPSSPADAELYLARLCRFFPRFLPKSPSLLQARVPEGMRRSGGIAIRSCRWPPPCAAADQQKADCRRPASL